MNQTTENDLLDLLKNYESMSIIEISSIMNLTKADVRYQVQKLVKKNKVMEVSPIAGLPGRPAKRYKVSPDIFNHNLDFLTSALMASHPDKTDLIEKLSDFYINNLKDLDQRSIISKLNSLVTAFTRLNYEARWETQFQGPTFYFGNCPYRTVIESNPELCSMDKMIISKIMNMAVKQHDTIAQGSSICKFLIVIKNLS